MYIFALSTVTTGGLSLLGAIANAAIILTMIPINLKG